MSINHIFPPPNPSDIEEDIVKQAFSLPAVRKYLRALAMNDAKELLSLSAITNDKERLAQAHAVVQGKLQVIGTLLSIVDDTATTSYF